MRDANRSSFEAIEPRHTQRARGTLRALLGTTLLAVSAALAAPAAAVPPGAFYTCGTCNAAALGVTCLIDCAVFRCAQSGVGPPQFRYVWAYDSFAPAGSFCGDGYHAECDLPDVCNGWGICVPNHKKNGTYCGDPTTRECDSRDVCVDGRCDPQWRDWTSCGDDADGCRDDVCFRGACFPREACPGTPCAGDTMTCDATGQCNGPAPATGPDMDGDGVVDAIDNCPMLVNGPEQDDQADVDGNGVGDACERGDVNCDGIVNTQDARMIQMYTVGAVDGDDMLCEGAPQE